MASESPQFVRLGNMVVRADDLIRVHRQEKIEEGLEVLIRGEQGSYIYRVPGSKAKDAWDHLLRFIGA